MKTKKNNKRKAGKEASKEEKKRHYIMIKGPIQEGDITIVHVYAPN